MVKKKFGEEEIYCTVKVGAVGVDRRDLGDGNVKSGFQSRLVGNLVEALDQDQSQKQGFVDDLEAYLHRSDPFFTLSLGNGPPLAPDSRVRAMTGLRSCNKREE